MNIKRRCRTRLIAMVLAVVIVTTSLVGCGDSETPTPTEPKPISPPTDVQTPTPSVIITPSPEPPPMQIITPEPVTPDVRFQLAKSHVERNSSPDVAEIDMNELVSGNNAFAFDLYQELQSAEGNLFFSPHSISAALAMTYAGARGDTEQQMADTMHFILPQNKLHPAFNALDIQLTKEPENVRPEEGDRFTLNIANSIWGQRDYEFLPDFLDAIAMNYGAGLRLVDFIAAPEPARVMINDWVSDQTEEKIENLIPQGAIDSMTRMVLANAIYFNASWVYPFDENSIQTLPFNLLDETQVDVSMMSQTEEFGYFKGEGYQVVELPYSGYRASMLILIPDSGQFENIESVISDEQITDILSHLTHEKIDLTMPKFSYESDFSLAQVLNEMGMPAAFNNADFSGMDGTKDLFISDVFHKAFVDVDETGTEAAAATAVVISLTGMPIPVEPIKLTIDRPFLFLIRDTATDSILFMGRVLNPAE